MGVFEDNSSLDRSKFGFRIYQLIKGGPLEKSNVKELSDFIIPPEEVLNRKITFIDWIKSYAGKKCKIKLYSLLTRNFKEIEVQANELESKDGILGAAIKYENWDNADKNLLHVTAVYENSFAEKNLGLIANDDYIIAVKSKFSPIISLNKLEFNPLEILNNILQQNKGNELFLYVYNKKKGQRIINFTINEDNFTLGCDVAYGVLHEFPREDSENKNNVNDEKNVENKNNEGEINKDSKNIKEYVEDEII